ncbi:MAG: RNA methyltransferase [Acidimicrobiales bacterium]|nr:RNA methyltransferase [Acidimicrobiales bacterium]
MSSPQHLAASNRRVVELRKLTNSRKARRDEQVFVVDGPRALSTLVAADAGVRAVFVDEQHPVESLPFELPDTTAVYELDRSVLASVAESKSPQGVLAVVELKMAALETVVAHPRVVVLDGVQDPGNVGAIVRAGAALGWGGVVVCSGCGDPWSPKAVRGSAGTIGLVDVLADIEVSDAIEALGVAGFTVVGADMNPSTEVTSIDPGQRLALVLGAEGAGLSAQARSAIDATVGIAMAPLVESLNVAVTAGILMHSLAR